MEKKVYLKDENVMTLFSLNNLIVPEIQREYVWGSYKKGEKVRLFLQTLKQAVETCDTCNHVHLKPGKHSVNVGFLYSYKPPYVSIEHERFLDEYLIDGQQRITTIFLLLCYLAVKEERQSDLCTLCRFDEESLGDVCFKYRVRSLTQMFITQLLSHIEKGGALDFENNKPNWLLKDYEQDATISSMLDTLRIVKEEFSGNELYYDFVLQCVHFWHFKTESTSQGEGLYITMNSRGEKLESCETIKAKLLSPEMLIEWGPKWELWNNFFWMKRGKNVDADAGMNEFLDCVQEMLRYRNSITVGSAPSHLTNNNVQFYEQALEYLCGYRSVAGETISEAFGRTMSSFDINWLHSYISELLDLIPYASLKADDKSNWYIDSHKEENYYNRMQNAYVVWSWMAYLEQLFLVRYEQQVDATDLDFDTLVESFSEEDFRLFFRVIHFFQIRRRSNKHNARQMFSIISKIVKDRGEHSFVLTEILDPDELDEEETFLTQQLYTLQDSCIEPEIWKLQAHDEMRITDNDKVGHTCSVLPLLNTVREMVNSKLAGKEVSEYLATMNQSLDYWLQRSDRNKLLSLLLFYNSDGWRQLRVGDVAPDTSNHSFWYCSRDWEKESRFITEKWRHNCHRQAFGLMLNDYVANVISIRLANPALASFAPDNILSLDAWLQQKRNDFFGMFGVENPMKKSALTISQQLIVYDYFIRVFDYYKNIAIYISNRGNSHYIIADVDIYRAGSTRVTAYPLSLPEDWENQLKSKFGFDVI